MYYHEILQESVIVHLLADLIPVHPSITCKYCVKVGGVRWCKCILIYSTQCTHNFRSTVKFPIRARIIRSVQGRGSCAGSEPQVVVRIDQKR